MFIHDDVDYVSNRLNSSVTFHKIPKNPCSSDVRLQFVLKWVIVTVVSITVNDFCSIPAKAYIKKSHQFNNSRNM